VSLSISKRDIFQSLYYKHSQFPYSKLLTVLWSRTHPPIHTHHLIPSSTGNYRHMMYVTFCIQNLYQCCGIPLSSADTFTTSPHYWQTTKPWCCKLQIHEWSIVYSDTFLAFLLAYFQMPLTRPWLHDSVMTTWLQHNNFSLKITFTGSIMISTSQLKIIMEYCTELWIKFQCHNCYKMALNKSLLWRYVWVMLIQLECA
jgi:hypothetical protein